MKRISSGSKHSPIAIDIDDSDEEGVLELLDANVANMASTTRSSSAKNQDMRFLQGNMVHHVASLNGNTHSKDRDLQGKTNIVSSLAILILVCPAHGGQKRKRTHADQHDDYAADPSHSKLQPSTLETRFSNPLSKKARKRRRKLERQAMEMAHPQQQFWMNRRNQLLPSFSWAPDNLPYQVLDSPSQVTSFTSQHPNLHQESRTKVSYAASPSTDQQHYDTTFSDRPIASTSAWVSSMALAAENPPHVVDSWTPPPPPQPSHSKRPSALEMTRMPPHSISVHPLPPKPHPEQPIASREPLEPQKPPPPAIGMKPDQDPSSKHGLFETPAAESSNGPNPARTLVIEQLPKSHRNADWVNSWCKAACGAHPVHLSINAQGAKALVEFATAELARKAWGSPRLGSNFAGLKSHQLKGKPREDLIKVWWYRVDGIGAGAGVGEIEEGEIEGDAAEKEVEVLVKKETKKERKARLAKERLDKQRKLPAVVKTSAESNPRPTPSSTTRPPASLPQKPPPIFVSSLPTLRPNLPTSGPHRHADQQDDLPSSVSQAYSYSAPYHHPLPSSRPALQLQSDLRAHWREQAEPARRFDGSFYGASVRQQGNNVDGPDSVSIASSRSPSPYSVSPTVQEVPLPSASRISLDVQPDIIDVDDVDMDLSPTTIRLPPKPHSVPPHPSQADLLSTPVPQTALCSPIHSPEPEAATPIPTSTGIPRASSAQNHLQPPSSASTNSSTPRGTPPLEPRAMKNAPKAPSYQKRSLLARKKELEERIAKSRLELGLDPSSGGDFPSTPTPSLDPPTEIPKKDDMEERLRMLVLQSQRSKVKAGSSPTLPITVSSSSLSTSTLSTSSEAVSSSSSSSSNSTGAVSPALAASDASASSLDDLAISFIQETIQTYKTSPAPVPIPTSKSKPPSFANTNTRLELAAKQKRLEQEIAETKILMARLAQTRTKQEKDRLLAEMREKTRCVSSVLLATFFLVITCPLSTGIFAVVFSYRTAGEENTTLHQPANDQHPSKLLSTQITFNWPTSHRDAGVLIVSDDEDDSDDTDDDI